MCENFLLLCAACVNAQLHRMPRPGSPDIAQNAYLKTDYVSSVQYDIRLLKLKCLFSNVPGSMIDDNTKELVPKNNSV